MLGGDAAGGLDSLGVLAAEPAEPEPVDDAEPVDVLEIVEERVRFRWCLMFLCRRAAFASARAKILRRLRQSACSWAAQARLAMTRRWLLCRSAAAALTSIFFTAEAVAIVCGVDDWALAVEA
jgi:hypothetical protein